MLNLFKKNTKWWALLAMSSALALVFIDQTALAVALPAMQRDLNLSNNLLSWIINGYLLSLSTLVLFGGKLGDSFGHKKIFLWGLFLFVGASLSCALATSGIWLLIARAIQGAGGALMMPSTNALVVNAFPEQERGKAMGIYVAFAAIFLAIGPLLGGALTQWISWRAVFWINLPISLASLFLTKMSIPDWERTEPFKMDYLGLILSIAFISGFVLCFMQGSHWGWLSAPTLGLFIFSMLMLVLFVYWEKQTPAPLVEMTLFKNPTFSLITAIMLIIQAVGISFIFWSIFLQNVLQYSSLKAGLLLLPTMIPVIFMSPIGGHLCDRYGPTWPMLSGCTLVLLSFLWIGFTSRMSSYAWLSPGLFLYGIGIPLMLSGSMATLMSTVSDQQRAIASAILNCARQLGNSIGLAILSGLLSSLNKWHLNAFLAQAPQPIANIQESQIDGLLAKSPAALQAIAHLPVDAATLIKTAALNAYKQAFSSTMFIASLFVLVCFLLILKLPRKPSR